MNDFFSNTHFAMIVIECTFFCLGSFCFFGSLGPAVGCAPLFRPIYDP